MTDRDRNQAKIPQTTSGHRHHAVVPLGPMFISYRASDGRILATNLAWALRAFGVPVWHDVTDLPPGDTNRRLDEALRSGLSGAVLMVTKEIELSTTVKEIELPRLLSLEEDSNFIFLVASAIEREGESGHLDFSAPDRLLGRQDRKLERMKQYPLVGEGALESIAKEVVLQRMKMHRALGESTLVLDLQTRSDPRVGTVEAGLVVRTPSPESGRRAPSKGIWASLASFFASLPQLVDVAGAERVLIRGGAHLSAAFSLGAALPSTAVWPVAVQDQREEVWGDSDDAAPVELTEEANQLAPDRRPVAVMVDLVPSPSPTDAFRDYLRASQDRYSASLRIAKLHEGMLTATAGPATVADIAKRVRRFSAQHETNRVHLFLRTPFPVALLLGRMFNTLQVQLYEWEDGIGRPHYVPTVVVASGRGASPITAICDPDASPSEE